MEVKMEFKKMFRSLLVIVFSLVMSNNVLGADTHKEFMKHHRMVLAGSQAALEQHRNQFPHLQEAANQAYDLNQRTVIKDLTAQILLEKHGQGHIPTVVQIALARSQAHMKASQAFLIPSLGRNGNMADLFNDLPEGQATNQEDQAVDYSDLPPVEHSPEPIAEQTTQTYLTDLAEFYKERNVPHDNETLKEFVRKHVIDSTVGVNGKQQELHRFYQTELKQMQVQGVDQEFIDQFGQDINALFDEIGTGQVAPGIALPPMQAVPAQDVSRSSSASSSMELDPLDAQMYSRISVESQGSRKATSVYMSDEDGENSPVSFDDRNRRSSSALNSTELHTPDSQVYFSPISGEPQESPVASPVQDVSRSSSVASQSDQSDSDDGDFMPSSDSDDNDSEGNDEDSEGNDKEEITPHKIYQSIDKSQTMEQQLEQANIIFQGLLKLARDKEDQGMIQEMHTDVMNMINEAFRNR